MELTKLETEKVRAALQGVDDWWHGVTYNDRDTRKHMWALCRVALDIIKQKTS